MNNSRNNNNQDSGNEKLFRRLEENLNRIEAEEIGKGLTKEQLEAKDVDEAIDAQSYVADTLRDLRGKIDAVTPQYRYVLEVTEFLHEVVPESATIRMGTAR